MKLEKAIETNEYLVELSLLHQCPDHADAIQLGIEAMKLVDNLRFDGSPYYPNLLPCETKE